MYVERDAASSRDRLTHFDATPFAVAGDAEALGGEFEVTSHGTLLKRSAAESDSGVYTCRVSGTSVQASAVVRVLRKPWQFNVCHFVMQCEW